MTTNANREAWLMALAALMAPHIEKAAGRELPPFRVSCGFPSSGGRKGGKSWTRGECWSASASADGHAEIFINPGLDESYTVAAILAHELIHAAMPEAGHRKPFQIAAKKIGHVAPFTTAKPTEAFDAWAIPLMKEVGEYPHRELRTAKAVGAKKAQKGRMFKAECDCGYTVRVARKWVAEIGAPHCPAHGEMIVDLPDDEDGDE